jgi:hypothetical protein
MRRVALAVDAVHALGSGVALVRSATSQSRPASGRIENPAVAESRKQSVEGYLAEFQFIHEGMRQDQRERHGFLGFTLAANGLVLGLLIGSDPPLKPLQVFYLVSLVALVTLVAERLTRRASQGVATAGIYLRLFVEPHVEGLRYQRRNTSFLRILKGNVSSSRGFAIAYRANQGGRGTRVVAVDHHRLARAAELVSGRGAALEE